MEIPSNIPVIDLTDFNNGYGDERFIVKVKTWDGRLLDIDCSIWKVGVDISEEKCERPVFYTGESNTARSLRYITETVTKVDISLHGKVIEVKDMKEKLEDNNDKELS